MEDSAGTQVAPVLGMPIGVIVRKLASDATWRGEPNKARRAPQGATGVDVSLPRCAVGAKARLWTLWSRRSAGNWPSGRTCRSR